MVGGGGGEEPWLRPLAGLLAGIGFPRLDTGDEDFGGATEVAVTEAPRVEDPVPLDGGGLGGGKRGVEDALVVGLVGEEGIDLAGEAEEGVAH